MTINTFSELLKKYRFDKNISQEDLGKQLNVATMTIHRWEKGTNIPFEKERKRVEDFINEKGTFLDPYELLTSEIKLLKEKIDCFTDFLKKFHE